MRPHKGGPGRRNRREDTPGKLYRRGKKHERKRKRNARRGWRRLKRAADADDGPGITA